MKSAWPIGVATERDMQLYVKTLFGECKTEDLLKGTQFVGCPGCYLWRVKYACRAKEWQCWPQLIDEAMTDIAKIHKRESIIEARAKIDNGPRQRLYDTIQVTPNRCTCRVDFGGDKHVKKHQTSSSSTAATLRMDQILMEKFKPTTEKWNENKSGYYDKAFHIVLNRYELNDGIDVHTDFSKTYHWKNPITSLTFGRGALLVIQDSRKTEHTKGIYYQYPGDAIVMSGRFNEMFLHAVPSVETWRELIDPPPHCDWYCTRSLPKREQDLAEKISSGVEDVRIRHNVTIRWHEMHLKGCPYCKSTTNAIALPKHPEGLSFSESTPGADRSPFLSDTSEHPFSGATCFRRGSVPPALDAKAGSVPPASDETARSVPAALDAVETDTVDTGPKHALDVAQKRSLISLLTDITITVPDWMPFCLGADLLPKRASEKRDYKFLKDLRNHQARYIQEIQEIKEQNFIGADDTDLFIISGILRTETRKLNVLEQRLTIYNTVWDTVNLQVAFNENRLSSDHRSTNDLHSQRIIVTFKQMKKLLAAIDEGELLRKSKLIVDIATIKPWDYKLDCYLKLNAFIMGTREIKPIFIKARYVQIKYLEASWPGDPVVHRLTPNPGSMKGHMKKKQKKDGLEMTYQEQKESADGYKSMLCELMTELQDYLLLTDDTEQTLQKASLDLCPSLQDCGDHLICFWLQQLWSHVPPT